MIYILSCAGPCGWLCRYRSHQLIWQGDLCFRDGEPHPGACLGKHRSHPGVGSRGSLPHPVLEGSSLRAVKSDPHAQEQREDSSSVLSVPGVLVLQLCLARAPCPGVIRSTSSCQSWEQSA